MIPNKTNLPANLPASLKIRLNYAHLALHGREFAFIDKDERDFLVGVEGYFVVENSKETLSFTGTPLPSLPEGLFRLWEKEYFQRVGNAAAQAKRELEAKLARRELTREEAAAKLVEICGISTSQAEALVASLGIGALDKIAAMLGATQG